MTAVVEWVKGETASRDFILRENGQRVDLTGATVTLDVWDRDGNPVNTSGDVAVVMPQTGTDKGRVRLTLDAADLDPLVGEVYVTVHPSDEVGDIRYYIRRARFKVEGGASAGYFPRGTPDLWWIYER